MELTFNQIMESEAYSLQKEAVARSINTLKCKKGESFPRFPEPGRIYSPDYKVFEKTNEEKKQLVELKYQYRMSMRDKFPGWTKRKSTKPEYITLKTKVTQ